MGDLKKKKVDHIALTMGDEGMLIEQEKSSPDEKAIARLRAYIELFYEKQLEKMGKEEETKMARYRTYKNGITGHRYQGYYIIKGDQKGLFQIWRQDKTVFQDHIYDYDECEWIIDKATASDETMSIIKQLYGMEIYQLSSLLVELMQKKEQAGLDTKNAELYKWVEKIRKRKAEDRLF